MDENTVLNKITIRGTIIASRMAAGNRAVYTIATDGDRGSSVFPEVMHILETEDEVWRAGENVTALCHARSGKTMTEDNKPIYFKQIVADRIFKTERILSSYFDEIPNDGAVPMDLNEFVFCGEVYRVTERPGGRNIVLVALKIQDEGNYSNYVEVAGFRGLADIMAGAKIGDIMAVAGVIRTTRRESRYVFDYVAKDVYLQKLE